MNKPHSPLRRLAPIALTAVSALLAAACSAAGSAAPDPGASGRDGVEPAANVSPTTKPKPKRRPYTIAFGGDVHFEGVLRTRLEANPKTALGPIAKVLRRADIAMVNLETAITTGGTPAPGKQYTFRAPPSALTALKAAGVDVASLANNHGMDYMESGLRDSLAAVRKARFPLVGAGENAAQAYKPWRTKVNGNRVAII